MTVGGEGGGMIIGRGGGDRDGLCKYWNINS